MAKSALTRQDVYFFIPNLIGYCRILFCTMSFYFCFHKPSLAMIYYFLGQGMDAVDGMAARHFDQASKFGALLDMLTDRCGTAVLMMVLSHLYPHAWGFFAFLISLDFVSHWFQMYASLAMGATSHKGSPNKLLNFYYTFPYALMVFCCGNELFVMALYLYNFYPDVPLVYYVLVSCFPIFAAKQFMNVVQLYQCANDLVDMDIKEAHAKVGKK